MKEPRSSTEIIISALHIIARDLEFTESAAVCEAAGRLEELDQQLRQLQGDNKALVSQNQYLRHRSDLPVDRIPAYKAHAARITELEESNERWRKIYQAEVIKSQECEKLRQERDELAANIERIKSAYDNCTGAEPSLSVLLRAIDEAPSSSLAEVRAQALEEHANNISMSMAPNRDYLEGYNHAMRYMRDQADRIRKEDQ